jgi:class 3 adenylate cyclase/tetratricopeptide (TPR) repeat protein
MNALLPRFILDRFARGEHAGTIVAHTLFVDISGFSAVTELLMQHGAEGAEVLSGIIGAIFEPMVETVHRHGGFITSFAGDAISVIFERSPENNPGHDALVVLHCATTIQREFRSAATIATRFGEFTFGVKAGISSGEIEWGIVGDAERAYYFRGEAIAGCGTAQALAARGEIVIDERFGSCIADGSATLRELDATHALAELVAASITLVTPPDDIADTDCRDTVSRFLPSAVIDGGHVGEFRDVTSVFLAFDGAATHAALDRFITIVLRRAREYSGYVEELQFSEGACIPCFFGAPSAVESSIGRALDFVLAIEQDVRDVPELVGLVLRAGVTHGRVFAGALGGRRRCQYALLGTMVNLAARMMKHASWGEILVAQRIAQQPGYLFHDRGDVAYHNVARPTPTFALIGASASSEELFTENMIGRVTELRMLVAFAQPIFGGDFAGIAYVYGEAGIGKSQLSHSLRTALAQGGALTWLTCQCDEVLRKPFHPFIPFLKRYFEQSPERSAADNAERLARKLEHLVSVVTSLAQWKGRAGTDEIVRDLRRADTVLGALIGLSTVDSLYSQLDAKARYDNTMSALRALFLAESIVQPVVIEIEDTQWIDGDSEGFLRSFVRAVEGFPILIVANARYGDDGSIPHIELEDVLEINLRLKHLSKSDLRLLAESILGGGVDQPLLELLYEKTLGNPFFVEQMLAYFGDHALVEIVDARWRVKPEARRRIVLPETISAILTARIDRLAHRVKEVVKAASVIGREFEQRLLAAVVGVDVGAEVKQAEGRQIWSAVNEMSYIFRHALLRDAAYDMQLRAQLRVSHRRAAEAIVELYGGGASEHYAEIAHHYERAEMPEEAITYLERAGDHAREGYQNDKAIELYDRLLSFLEDVPERASLVIRTLRTKGKVCELIGRWADAEALYRRAIDVAELARDERSHFLSQRSLSWLQYLRGDLGPAMEGCSAQLPVAESNHDEREIASIMAEMGGIHAALGEHAAALECHARSLAISRALDDPSEIAQALNNLGSVYDVTGEMEAAMEHYRQALSTYEMLNDRRHIAAVLGNIGVLHSSHGQGEEALRCYRRQLEISEEIGDTSGSAIAVGNMGIAYDQQGDFASAVECYDRALSQHRAMGYHAAVAGWLQGKAEAGLRIIEAQRTMTDRERRGRLMEARGWAEECVALSTQHDLRATRIAGGIVIARITHAAGDREVALRQLHEQLAASHDDEETEELESLIAKMSE